MASRTFNSKKYGKITVISTYVDRTWTSIEVDVIITEEEALLIQEKLGYHPCGYGFYSFAVKGSATTWKRSNSCD
jgi:hypothetical protein